MANFYATYPAGGSGGIGSLNGLTGNLNIVGANGITVTASGTTITITDTNSSGLLGPFTILDNQSTPATILTYAATTFPFTIVHYSVVKSGVYRVGRFLIANDGASTSFTDDYTETSTTGVTFSALVSGANVNVNYISTSTGANGVFKCYTQQWS